MTLYKPSRSLSLPCSITDYTKPIKSIFRNKPKRTILTYDTDEIFHNTNEKYTIQMKFI